LKYSIDTSAILDGRKRYYPKDVFPTVWKRLDYLIMGGRLLATEEVLRELEKQDDDVYSWVKARESRMVVPIDGPTQVEVSTILKTYPKLVREQRNRNQADPFVIALARVVNGVVVSGEKRRSLINPKIPDVCHDMGITHMELVDVFRREGFSI
jgi:hypothetical protein